MVDVGSYRDNGYVLLKGLFQRPEVDLVRDDAKRVFSTQMQRLGLRGILADNKGLR